MKDPGECWRRLSGVHLSDYSTLGSIIILRLMACRLLTNRRDSRYCAAPPLLFCFYFSYDLIVTGFGACEPERGQGEEGAGRKQKVVRLQQRFHVGKAKVDASLRSSLDHCLLYECFTRLSQWVSWLAL